MNLNDGKKINNIEAVSSSPDKLLVEYRQIAVAEGIPLSEIDQYLLERSDVPDSVKNLIRKDADQGAVQQEQSSSTSSAESVGLPPSSTEIDRDIEASEKPDKPEIKGDVDILDVEQQMKRIKQEYGESRMGTETENLGSIEQTAEKKEYTTTQGTQNTSSGVQKRLTLDDSAGVIGYRPSPEIANRAQDISSSGDVGEAKTWQATILQRLWEMWGSLKDVFPA